MIQVSSCKEISCEHICWGVWNTPQWRLRWTNHAINSEQSLYSKIYNCKFDDILLHCTCTEFVSPWFLVTFKKSELCTYSYTHRYTHADTHTHWLLYAFSTCASRQNDNNVKVSQNDVHMYLVLSHIGKYFVICTHAHTIIPTLSPERERKLKYNEACMWTQAC